MDTLTTGRVNAQQPSGEPLNEMLPLSSRLQRLAYPLLRIGFAAIMLTHGIPKMLGLLSCSNENLMCGLIGLIGNVLQLPAPGLLAMLVMLLETLGALMVAAGLKARIVASLMVVHLCAAAYVHTQVGGDLGLEMPLPLALIALYLVLNGSGPQSIDRYLGWEVPVSAGARHE